MYKGGLGFKEESKLEDLLEKQLVLEHLWSSDVY